MPNPLAPERMLDLSTCGDCGRPAVPFTVTDDVWNAIIGGPGGVLCLSCLHSRAVAAGVAPTTWCVEPNEWAGRYSVAQQMADERAEQENRAESAELERDRLRARVRELEEALRPFAEYYRVNQAFGPQRCSTNDHLWVEIRDAGKAPQYPVALCISSLRQAAALVDGED